MNMPWIQNGNQSEVRAEESTGEDQLSLIPRWSVVLAIIVFGAVQYLFHGVMPHHPHELLPMRLRTGYSWGTAVASTGRVVDADCGADAGWHRRGGVLPAASTAAALVPQLPDRGDVDLSFLPTVSVPDGSGLWAVLPRRADHRCVLHNVWP